MNFLDFEKPVIELEKKIAELKFMKGDENLNIVDEISRMQGKVERMLRQAYTRLSPAQTLQVARHPDRPHFADYIKGLVRDFTPLSGDRQYGEDRALIGGIGRIHDRPCVVMGHEKGRDTEDRLRHNFGMARPEGYRKAVRLAEMAEQFNLPIVTLVDTAGAYPGLGAEERGQSEAIARAIESFLNVRVPVVSVVVGEGGSGGAVAIAVADRIFMMEYAVYSVISPEGCASILWRSKDYAADAASALKLTAEDLLELKLIDGVIREPVGAAHRSPDRAVQHVGQHIKKALRQLDTVPADKLVCARKDKFLEMGRD